MAIDLPQNDITIAGFTLPLVRRALQYVERYRSLDFTRRADLVPDVCGSACLAADLVGREFVSIRGSEVKLTDAGRAISHSNTMRYRKAVADRVLKELLTSVERHNRDASQLYEVVQVWQFGSTLRDQETVGDLDIAVEYQRRSDIPAGSRREREVILDLEELAPSSVDSSYAPRWAYERSVFGPRKHPMISLVPTDELVALACPCRLVFDASRGGIVDDPVLEKHPNATKPGKRIFPKATLPDLTTANRLPSPLHASWTCADYSDHYCPGEPFAKWHDRFSAKISCTASSGSSRPPDGVSCTNVTVTDPLTGATSTATFERRIEETPAGIEIVLGLTSARGTGQECFHLLGAVAATLAYGDVELVKRWLNDLKINRPVSVKFDLSKCRVNGDDGKYRKSKVALKFGGRIRAILDHRGVTGVALKFNNSAPKPRPIPGFRQEVVEPMPIWTGRYGQDRADVIARGKDYQVYELPGSGRDATDEVVIFGPGNHVDPIFMGSGGHVMIRAYNAEDAFRNAPGAFAQKCAWEREVEDWETAPFTDVAGNFLEQGGERGEGFDAFPPDNTAANRLTLQEFGNEVRVIVPADLQLDRTAAAALTATMRP